MFEVVVAQLVVVRNDTGIFEGRAHRLDGRLQEFAGRLRTPSSPPGFLAIGAARVHPNPAFFALVF